jgi:8-oxo-dGTP diphosphatase
MSGEKKSIEVVAAVIAWDGKVLCVQRGANKRAYISEKWEFPGGKVEAGESFEAALAREIREELRLEIEVGERVTTVSHEYPDFHLTMHAFACTLVSEEQPVVTLTEHLAYEWLSPESVDFRSLDWAAADVPIVEALTPTQAG